MPILYQVANKDGILVVAAQGRNMKATKEEADALRKAIVENNPSYVIRQVYGCEPHELRVGAFDCYEGHHDPKSIYALSEAEVAGRTA